MTEGRKPEYPEKTPGDELQKMPQTTARRFKPQTRLEPAQQHWWQARKAGMLTVTPRVASAASLTFSHESTNTLHSVHSKQPLSFSSLSGVQTFTLFFTMGSVCILGLYAGIR